MIPVVDVLKLKNQVVTAAIVLAVSPITWGLVFASAWLAINNLVYQFIDLSSIPVIDMPDLALRYDRTQLTRLFCYILDYDELRRVVNFVLYFGRLFLINFVAFLSGVLVYLTAPIAPKVVRAALGDLLK